MRRSRMRRRAAEARGAQNGRIRRRLTDRGGHLLFPPVFRGRNLSAFFAQASVRRRNRMHSAARARPVYASMRRRAARSPGFPPTRRPLPIRFCQPARQPGAFPSHFYPHSLRHDAPVFPARRRALLPGFIPIPPRREKFLSPSPAARKNFFGNMQNGCNFLGVSRVYIYRGSVTGICASRRPAGAERPAAKPFRRGLTL